ncbi:MAG: large conductance mechanosensitive channel protein MscL [Acholeplasmataceae bacterium]|jgi:large conductance mechanosensitive channel|nr:large conductance mechanosensitive channel protein MscL [Acholeplasmataceae bacterium]
MKKFFQDFKKFIAKGNVLDLAVAVIIGGAFGKIISSLVNHILMPVISLIAGKKSFEDIKTVLTPADEVAGITENAIYWGLFIQNVIDFLIIALVIFIIIRAFSKMSALAEKAKQKAQAEEIKAKEESDRIAAEEAAKQPKQPTVEGLLQDIKVLLEKQAKS